MFSISIYSVKRDYMEIYRIFNTETGKSYIGQTTKTFKQRYWGKWYNSTQNQYLKNSVQKHGENKFAIQILESNISSFDELDNLEKHYIQKFMKKGFARCLFWWRSSPRRT